ncbi:MAG: NotI family restriction endonuclease [Candidatus Portnoybacteria bacterium]|nr:NotI family restriction endonuclease [Candidatus Portnoybacteria bacterium]MDD4982985.1 NotI family restriction endonuclease [Candidatus Portnoybacteria bacterium]
MKKSILSDCNPLGEVFGCPTTDQSERAKRLRSRRLCPFNNKVPSCTKDKAKNPLGVCSVNFGESPVITCPIRFREDWLITDDAADFFFPKGAKWTTLTEVRLNDSHDKTAGNIDVVLVAYDEKGKVYDFGAIEIQAVYISGNIRDPFEKFMQNPEKNSNLDWSEGSNYPRPDYLSSSRKRLAPQLLFKGGILNAWKKKVALVLNKSFFDTLPKIKRVDKEKADLAWFLYDLVETDGVFKLKKVDVVYSSFSPTMNVITKTKPGNINNFIKILQEKVDEQMETPPINRTLEDSLIK